MLILIAGPVRSGTNGNQVLIHENIKKLDQIALQVYQRGHTPVIGEWLALPLASAAGSQTIGDEISESFLYPVAHRLIHCCMLFYAFRARRRGLIKMCGLARSGGWRSLPNWMRFQ